MAPDWPVTNPLGEALRGQRLRRGLEVQEIAAATRIPRRHIEAIERGQFDSLPSGVYRSSFLRQYARLLGLDESEIITSFHQQYQEPELPLPAVPHKRRPAPLGLLCLMLVAGALIGIYDLWQRDERARSRTENHPAVQARIGHAERVQEAPAKEIAAPAPAPAPPPDESLGLHVSLSATEPVWVMVTSDGVQVFSGTLAESQAKQFEGSRKITVLVGNAAGLLYSMNGKTYGPAGVHGETQLLEFTETGARILSRRPPSKPSANVDANPQTSQP